MQPGAPGQFSNPGVLLQLLSLRRAPDPPRVRKTTLARDQSHRSEHEKVFPNKVRKEHGLP